MPNLPLADEFFLIGHDDYSGKPRINADTLDTGLAGAVLAELVMTRRVDVAEGRLMVRDRQTYGEPVTDAALAELIKQAVAHPVRAWVEFLRADVRMMVGRRLLAAGLVEQVSSRGLLRSTTRFVARDPMAAASPRVRVRYVMDHEELLDEHTATLAALMLACGLEQVLATGGDRQVRVALKTMADRLPADLRSLASGVDAAVAAIALTIRR
jgi:Golgi phosphoprotein 3 (GPP34)